MKYRKQLLQLMAGSNADAMMDWVLEQPLLEQPDILREFKELILQLDIDGSSADLVAGLDEEIDRFEDKILDHKLAEAQFRMALENHEKTMKEMDGTPEGFRIFIIDCIVTNAPNAEEMRRLAKRMMEFEKETGIFDPDNWREIL